MIVLAAAYLSAPGGAGSFHGGTVPIWLIVVAVAVILAVGIGIIARRRSR